jgi:hypothetical protein
MHQLRKSLQNPKFKTGQASLGALVHEYWLEPELAKQRWSVLPKKWEGNSPEARKKRAALISEKKAQGRSLVPESLWEKVSLCLEALEDSAEAMALRSGAQCEGVLNWCDGELGVKGKAKYDLLQGRALWDLKCFRGGRRDGELKRMLYGKGYLIQAWWHGRGLFHDGIEVEEYGHLVLDTETHTVHKRPMTRDELDLGRLQALRAWKKIDDLKLSWIENLKAFAVE